MSCQRLTCKGIYDWEPDWEGGSWKRGIVEHIESKEFILQLKTPRRDVIICVQVEFIWVANLFQTMNVMIVERISYPKILWPTINGMFLEWSLIFWSKSPWLFGLNTWSIVGYHFRSGLATQVKGTAKIYTFLLIIFLEQFDILEQ